MVDPVQLRPKGEVQADREALEHIARAVQGRVLRGPGTLSPAGALGLETLSLSRASIEALLEAMPAAIGILTHGDLVHANAAFAYAFGYRSFDELASAGGLEAIVPGGVSLLNEGAANGGRADGCGRGADPRTQAPQDQLRGEIACRRARAHPPHRRHDARA